VTLFKTTPAYFGEGLASVATKCPSRPSGFLAYLGELLGFPPTPCYASPEPDPPCEECPPCDDLGATVD